MRNNMINLLSCDPGSRNFGWAVLSGKTVNGRVVFKVIANGMCPCPVNQVKDSRGLREQQLEFAAWFASMLAKYDIHAVCAERFMTRGLLGPLVEFVGIMMGVMLCESKRKPFKVFPAAIWKNAVRRNTGSKTFLNDSYKITKVLPHQLDAVLMGVWVLFQGFKKTDFQGLDLTEVRNDIFNQVEATSQTKLINRKNKR